MMITNHKLLPYALNKDNNWVYIEDVPNGLECNCHCPCCKESLIARNNGIKREHHFAHSSGSNCHGYYETTLHLLSKEIIQTEKAIMLPEYGFLESQQLVFEKVEVEERNDYSNLQPDCVGITKDGLRLHIEICVTHQIDDFKKSKIKEGNINCIEIRIPCDLPLDIKQLKDFLLFSTESREWINYPYSNKLYSEQQKKKIIAYQEQHPELRELLAENCKNCMGHSAIRIKKKYDDFINSYINRIHIWAIRFAKMTPNDIINQNLSIRYLAISNIPYIHYNGKDYWIFPRAGERTTDEEMMRCKSTYDFFQKLTDMCTDYVNSINTNRKCEHEKAKFEYKGQSFIFCNYKK